MKYGKAGGAFLLRRLLPDICDINNIFVFNNMEGYKEYVKADEIKRLGLKSFGIQGMIRDGKLFPIKVNRRKRFAPEQDLVKEKRQVKLWGNPQLQVEQQKEGLETLTRQVSILPTDEHKEAQDALGCIIKSDSGRGCGTNG